MNFICWVAIIATVSAFILALMYKWGIVEWLQVHGNEYIARLAGCNLCMSFWLTLFISIGAAYFSGNVWVLLAPLCATSIARRLL